MSYPPPAAQLRPVLIRRDPPEGPVMAPRRTEAEVLYADGSWRPAMVLSWHRLDVTHRQPITQRWIFWLVQLRLAGGEEAWFEFDSLNLRPQR